MRLYMEVVKNSDGLYIEFFLSAGVRGVHGASVGDGRDPVLFQVESMGMGRLERGAEVRESDARCVLVGTVETDALDSLTVHKARHEDHHDREEDENEDYRRGDAHPLTQGIVVNSVILFSAVPRDTGVVRGHRFGGCGLGGRGR